MYPARGLSRYGVLGKVVDANTSNPLTKSKVVLSICDEGCIQKTDSAGIIRLPPHYILYLTWTLCGPIIQSKEPTDIKVSVEGYQTATLLTTACDIPPEKRKHLSPQPAKREGDYFILGTIRMKK